MVHRKEGVPSLFSIKVSARPKGQGEGGERGGVARTCFVGLSSHCLEVWFLSMAGKKGDKQAHNRIVHIEAMTHPLVIPPIHIHRSSRACAC